MSESEIEGFIRSITGREGPFQPFAYDNQDGDSIEFWVSEEMYYAKEIIGRFTLYIGEKSGKVVGGEIVGVSRHRERKDRQ